ncbi:hypothetical protein [Budvicia aquatica]|uniref:Uncharacterized protein n=1 Tax=Budvicia aquatica TaxID=82979 RepID=A0A484ZRV2_9GAMM|nr:hypothetical protein [Budvicia aquatica]VFS51045.1 Uncharacterised protein [Budvicia aquatica]
MNNMKMMALSTSLMLTATVGATPVPATNKVTAPNELIASNGMVNVVDSSAIAALNTHNFIYSGYVSVTQTLNTPVNKYGVGISIFNSIMQLGKTDVVINFADGATGSSYISAVRLKNGSTGSLPAALAQTVTAEFGAGSTFIINGNNHVELIGIDIEAGLYTPALLLPDMTAFLNENTTVTLNKAGNSSVGLYSYISGGKIKTKDGLLVNVNTDNHSTVYGIRAQGISTPTTVGGVVELEGTSTINIVNGGTGSTGILAHQIGGKVTALKRVTINNTTTDSTAMLYGLWASKGVIDFSGPTAITLDGGMRTLLPLQPPQQEQ